MKPSQFEWRSPEVRHRQALRRLDCYPWSEATISFRQIAGWSITISMIAATMLGLLIIGAK